MAKYMKERRQIRREKLVALLDGICFRCGSNKNLEFNHRNRFLKKINLSGKGLDKPWLLLVAETEKCDLLCKPWHQLYTAQQYKNKEIAIWNSKKHLPFLHGTCRCYNEMPCRCANCKKAKQLYRNKLLGYDELIP